jgi:glycosylphosphatidylinositol transamidase
VYSAQNLYAILQAPRGDATEALVLVAAWRTIDDELNRNGVALALSLARYFRRWSLWSKDIIILIPPDSRTGTQAWVDAYHNSHDPAYVSSLPLKSGLLQGVVALDYPHDRRFESVHVVYDGVNGQLPNLDLINSVVNIAGGQMGMPSSIQRMYQHSGKYADSQQTMFRGMLKQALGHATGPHSSFIPYHVDAVTIQPHGEGRHDEMAMGRLVEGSFRSLNNLLEHLHQSFFFYLLMRKDRFVSIGTYLPSAMLVAANFTIMAIYMWVRSGRVPKQGKLDTSPPAVEIKMSSDDKMADRSSRFAPATERDLFVPLGVVAACQALGIAPLFIFNHIPSHLLPSAFAAFTAASSLAPHAISHLLTAYFQPTVQQYELIKCFSLLLLGMFLSSLATLNFSLAFLIGLLATPLSFTPASTRSPALRWVSIGILNVIAPTAVLYSACSYGGIDVSHVLKEAAFGWNVWGMYTPMIIWCVWWPAWLAASINALGEPAPTEMVPGSY